MISDPRAFSSDTAWHFAFSNFGRILREQQYVLMIFVLIDVVLSLVGFKYWNAASLAAYPLFASLMRVFQPRFAMTGRIVFRMLVLNILTTLIVGAIPFAFFLFGKVAGNAVAWTFIGCLGAIPLALKLLPATPLLLLTNETSESITDVIAYSWRAMGGRQMIEAFVLIFKFTLLVV